MSEMLGFELDDAEEMEVQNEEDLLQIGDEFAEIELKEYVIERLNNLSPDIFKFCYS
jgi:hypothetical protein